MPKCSYCGKEVSMPYKCKFCGKLFCSEHRLPENHECEGLDDWQRKRKEEKKEEIMYEPFIQGKNIEEREPSPKTNVFRSLEDILPKRTTYLLIGIMVAGFVIEIIMGMDFSIQNFGLLPSKSWSEPWRIITSIFLHGGIWHLFANGMTLYFLGTYLERLVGKKYFLYTFFLGGIAGGLFYISAPVIGLGSLETAAIGASGAIFAVGAALAILRPKLQVFVFPLFIPVPLYIAIFGIFLILSFLPGVAWQGHLGGLVAGVLFGYWFKKTGKGKPTVEDFMRDMMESFQ